MRVSALGYTLVFLSVVAFQPNNELFVVPQQFPEPVYDFSNNPLSRSKVQLGRALFYDPILSRNNTISCSSCHSQYSAFTHADHALSHGIDDNVGFRNAPALMNLAWQSSFMRDGAINHLDMQSLAPISDSTEMDETILNVVTKLNSSVLYQRLFLKAYNDSIATGERVLKAISQFMLTIISSNSKYDSVIQGRAQFTPQESNGYSLFKSSCASCHTEPMFTNDGFRNNGLRIDTSLNDFGRYRVTKNPSDLHSFKVPTLRNIEYSYPYMHDGRFKTLSQVLNHYLHGIVRDKTLSTELRRQIVLTSNEKVDIIAFLLTLSDRSFIFNPRYSYPKEIFTDVSED